MSLAAVATVAAALVSPGLVRDAQAACNTTAVGRVLVMSNNVYEVDKRDARRTGDMRRFVGRMKDFGPNIPDVVLVQEARKRAVVNIERFMERKFGCVNFTIAKNASKSGWQWIRKYTRLGGQDVAVIVNTSTMQVRRSGFISHGYSKSAAARGESVKVKKTAWVDMVERPRLSAGVPALRVVAASSHYPRSNDFKSTSTSMSLKKKFIQQTANKLEKVAPEGTRRDSTIHVIGGDLNNPRFVRDPSNPTPLYSTITKAPYGYVDGPISLYEGGNPNPIDFLFSTGKPLKAKMDKGNTHNEDSRKFYSNHDLRWSLLSSY